MILGESWALHNPLVSRVQCKLYGGYQDVGMGKVTKLASTFLAPSSIGRYWKSSWKLYQKRQ